MLQSHSSHISDVGKFLLTYLLGLEITDCSLHRHYINHHIVKTKKKSWFRLDVNNGTLKKYKGSWHKRERLLRFTSIFSHHPYPCFSCLLLMPPRHSALTVSLLSLFQLSTTVFKNQCQILPDVLFWLLTIKILTKSLLLYPFCHFDIKFLNLLLFNENLTLC